MEKEKMPFSIKTLLYFVLSILFNKNEYKLNSKEFNPLRFIVVIILALNVFFSVYLLFKVEKFYNEAVAECPKLKDKLK